MRMIKLIVSLWWPLTDSSQKNRRRLQQRFRSDVVAVQLVVVLSFFFLLASTFAFSTTPATNPFTEIKTTRRRPTSIITTSSSIFPLFVSRSTSSSSTTIAGGDDDYDSSSREREEQQPPRRRPQSSSSSPGNNSHNRTLLDELYYLRNKRNGATLAEQRLQKSIQQYLQALEQQEKKVQRHPEDEGKQDDQLDGKGVDPSSVALPSLNQLPTERCFNLVITAYSKISHRDWMAPNRANQLLQQMIQLSTRRMTSSSSSDDDDNGGTKQQQKRLQSMMRPTIFTYNSVMEAYLKSVTSNSPTSTTTAKISGGGTKTTTSSSSSSSKVNRRQQQNLDVVLSIFRQLLMSENKSKKKRSQKMTATSEQEDDTIDTTNNNNAAAVRPNTYSYNLILSLKDPTLHEWKLAESWALSCIQKQLLLSSSSTEENGHDNDVTPDRQTINLLMASYAQVGDAIQAYDLLLDLLTLDSSVSDNDKSEDSKNDRKPKVKSSHPLVPPKVVWFHCVLKALGKSCDNNNDNDNDNYNDDLLDMEASIGDQADDILEQMIRLSSSSPSLVHLKPDITTYNHVLNVHSNCGNTNRAMELLNQLEKDYTKNMKQRRDVGYVVDGFGNDDPPIAPDRITYTTVLKAFSTRQKQITQHHKHRHQQLQQQQQQTSFLMDETALTSSSSSSSELALEIAQNATSLFERMKVMAESGGRNNISPNTFTYNTLIYIWTLLGTRTGMQKATDLLQEMQQDSKQQALPDSSTYAILIHGWTLACTKRRLLDAGYRAEELLRELEQLPPGRQRQYFSRTNIYNSVMTAWAKSSVGSSRKANTIAAANTNGSSRGGNNLNDARRGSSSTTRQNQAPERVEYLLSLLERKYLNGQKDARPDRTTFLCMLDAYAKAGVTDAEERCEALLQRMTQWKDVFQMDDLEPDTAIYNGYLNALAKSYEPNAADKAEEILTMMQTSPDEYLRPDIVTYSTVIDCHTKCGSVSITADQRADELLRFVEGSYRSGDVSLKPNAVFYSAILQAWAKTATAKGAEYAENLLRRNLALYEEGYDYAKPHTIMYNAVMDAIARTGQPEAGSRAEELLDEMISLYRAGNEDMKPTKRSFNAVMLAYRSNGDGGVKAEDILYRMEKLADSTPELFHDVSPDVVSYNCAIDAIVHGKRDIGNSSDSDSEEELSLQEFHEFAADRAQALLDRMEERSVQPDGRTYSSVIEAWLKRNDEKGQILADVLLRKFLDHVESTKVSKEFLYEDAVWNVINAYRHDGSVDTMDGR